MDERTLSVLDSSTSAGVGGLLGSGGGLSGSGAGGVPSHAGARSGNAGKAGEAGERGEGGEAGASEAGPPAVFADGCTDLDRSGSSDCTQTLVQNPDFKSDVLPWAAESGATIAWDPVDLLAIPGSGSALVSSTSVLDNNGDFLVAANQCLPVAAGNVLEVYANARLEAGAVVARAAVSLWFFRQPDCLGDTPSDAYETSELFETGTTLTLAGSKPVEAQLQSVRVRLAVIKPFRAESVSVRFDNVLVVAH